MKNKRRWLLAIVMVGVLVFVVACSVSQGTPQVFKGDNANATELKYVVNTSGPWAYIEVTEWNETGLLELDAFLLKKLDAEVEAVGKTCGEHLIHQSSSQTKGVLCKVQ